MLGLLPCVCAGVWFGMVAVSVVAVCKALKGAGFYAPSHITSSTVCCAGPCCRELEQFRQPDN